jgi:hypothetical protein
LKPLTKKNTLKKLLLIPILLFLFYSCSSEEETQTPVIQYTLTVTAGDGGSVDVLGGTYNENSNVTVTATADEGYAFSVWSDGSTNSALTITMSSNKRITATFKLIPNNYCDLEYDEGEYSIQTYFDSELPEKYKSDACTIISYLDAILPFNQYTLNDNDTNTPIYGLDIFTWSIDSGKPFSDYIGNDGGLCVCGTRGNNTLLLLEFSNQDLINEQNIDKYAIIAHEMFHAYQHFKSNGIHPFKNFWLIEGMAETFASIFQRGYYPNSNYFDNHMNVTDEAFANIETFEHYDTFDPTLPDISVYMILVLSKKLQNDGLTESESFSKIFNDYFASNPTETNWKSNFEEVFSISVQDFYAFLPTYQDNPSDVIPSESLTLENIFLD